ncbi:MAG: hypothetical protein IPH61_12415 [Bacteroidetes bacterium]|nr:hypothetical protein [Bacteroidota bacterium]
MNDIQKIDSLKAKTMVLAVDLPSNFKSFNEAERPRFFPNRYPKYYSEKCYLLNKDLNMGFLYVRYNDWVYKEYVNKIKNNIPKLLQLKIEDLKFAYGADIKFFQNRYEYIEGHQMLLTEYRTLFGTPDTMFYHMDILIILKDTYAEINILGSTNQDSVLDKIRVYAYLIKNSIRVIEESERDSTRMLGCVGLY